jgi:hypothetical protein
MENLQLFKKKEINNYINSLDLNTEIDVNQIKRDLRDILQEEPGIQLNYVNEEMLMEDGKSKRKFQKLESIEIIYTYTKSIPDGNGGSIDMPIPATEKYIIG